MQFLRLPFRWQLAATLGALAFISIAVFGWLSYSTARNIVEQEAVQAVGIAAEAREVALTQRILRRHDRLQRLLESAIERCKGGRRAEECVEDFLERFRETEGALAARLISRDGKVFQTGDTAANLDIIQLPSEGEVVRFGNLENPYYLIRTESKSAEAVLIAAFGLEDIKQIFLSRYGLGRSGETFLVDANGFFITAPRYETDTHLSHAITAPPMKQCLAGHSGQAIDEDYRKVLVVHGFRYLQDLGAICIMAHIDYRESLEPAFQLRAKLLAASTGVAVLAILFSLVLARLLTAPLATLRRHVTLLETGRYEVPVEVKGPAEIRNLAQSFLSMAKSLQARQDELRYSEQQTRAILEHALDAIVTIDEQGTVTQWNAQAEQLFGWSKSEAMGRDLKELIVPESLQEAHGRLYRLLTEEGRLLRQRLEMTARDKGGKEFPIELSITPVQMGDRYLFTAFIEDIRERKRSEWERERLVEQLTQERQRLEESERKLHEQVSDLEIFHDVAVGRELKMIALEKEVLGLRSQLERGQIPSEREEKAQPSRQG